MPVYVAPFWVGLETSGSAITDGKIVSLRVPVDVYFICCYIRCQILNMLILKGRSIPWYLFVLSSCVQHTVLIRFV